MMQWGKAIKELAQGFRMTTNNRMELMAVIVALRQLTRDGLDVVIYGTNAGVIIGDRALKQLDNFNYVYDLAEGWKDYTGLPFVFAAWVANKELPADFLAAFDAANADGLKHIDNVVAANPFPFFDLKGYYTEHIHYYLDEEKRKGLNEFLQLISP